MPFEAPRKQDGNEVIRLKNGQVLHLDVRDDIRENDEDLILPREDDVPIIYRNRSLKGALKLREAKCSRFSLRL